MAGAFLRVYNTLLVEHDLPMPLALEIVAAAHAALMRRFRYVEQPNEKGPWVTHLAEVLAGQMWYGDCDDYATTACHYLQNGGWPVEKLAFQLCTTRLGILHVVCIAVDDAGNQHVLDNRHPQPYLMHENREDLWQARMWWKNYVFIGNKVFAPQY